MHWNRLSSRVEVDGTFRLDGENVRRCRVPRCPEDEWTKIRGTGARNARPPLASIATHRVEGVSHRERDRQRQSASAHELQCSRGRPPFDDLTGTENGKKQHERPHTPRKARWGEWPDDDDRGIEREKERRHWRPARIAARANDREHRERDERDDPRQSGQRWRSERRKHRY